MTQRYVQTPTAALLSSVGISETEFTITPYPKDLDGNSLDMADFGTAPTFTADPKISGYEEICSFAGITDNGNDTATLTGITRDLLSVYPYTAGGNAKQHGANAKIVFSDNPQLFNRLASKENDEHVTGQWTFDSFPITPSTPNASVTVIGMTKLSAAPASPTNPIAVGDNDTRVPTQGENDALQGTGTPSGSNRYVTADTLVPISAKFRFGGTGADGPLAVTAADVVIDLGGVQVFTKNYTTITISNTFKVSFINPHANGTVVIFKATGNGTMTSSASPNIDLRLLGAPGGLSDQTSSSTGRGGRGGGVLYIECAGALNYTGSINASGQNGTTNTGGVAIGNNGGGGGGMVVILANAITANTGTTTVAAGTAAGSIGGGNGGAAGSNGSTSFGIYGQYAGGNGGGTTNPTLSTIFGITPSLLTLSSKYVPLMPGAGGGGGGGGFSTTSGGTGSGMAVSIIGTNVEFA